MNMLSSLLFLTLQIPQNIEVNDSGDTLPLGEASDWMIGFIIVLLVAVFYYILVYKRRR